MNNKASTHRLLRLGLVMISLFVTFQVKAQPCLETTIKFEQEINVDLSKYFKSKASADTLSSRFKRTCLYSSAPEDIDYLPVDTEPEIVNMQAIKQLYDTAKSHANQCKKGYLTGVRITFGMRHGKMVYFYQPLVLCYNGSSFDVDQSFLSPYYQYNDKSRRFEESDTTGYCSEYYRSIHIDHFDNRELVPFIQFKGDGNWQGDTKAIIFSFTELFTLYHSNMDTTEGRCDYCQYIAIHNGAAYYRQSGPLPSKYRLKHTLYVTIVGSNKVAPHNREVLYAANLAHLCPPSCNYSLKYPILRKKK